jgi:rhamnogalacturonyl hydrolase YesR
MSGSFVQSFSSLKAYCEKKDYAGWDPYDGLNSTLFQAFPGIRKSRWCRLIWIQFFKKSPINFRRITGVPEEHNAKGLALFLTGYCNLFKVDPRSEYKESIYYLAEEILKIKSKGYSGACWGYNFDWQARAFFQPRMTPTVVATSFVADALLTAYDTTKENRWLEAAVSSAQFVLKDLNKTYDKKGNYAFSYSPLDNTQVFNASLLGGRLLSRVFAHTKEDLLREEARKVMQYACDHQRPDGAWAYGTLPFHQWVDNFHTGFNLECIHQYQKFTGDRTFQSSIEKGFQYYLENFFTANGIPKYYDNNTYPIDIHSPAQLVATLYKLERVDEYRELVEKVLTWTINHMQGGKGYFFYQKGRFLGSRICYMRWAQAWMFYAFTYYFISLNDKEWIKEL